MRSRPRFKDPSGAPVVEGKNRLRLLRRVLATDAFVTTMTTSGVMAIGLVTGIVTARTLGPQGRGEYLTTFAWSGVLGLVLTAGVAQATVTHARVGADVGRLRTLVLWHLSTTAALSAVIGLLVLHLDVLGWLSGWHVAALVLHSTGFVCVADLTGLAQGVGDIRGAMNRARIGSPIAGLLAIIGLLLWDTPSPVAWLICVGTAQLAVGLCQLIPRGAYEEKAAIPTSLSAYSFVRSGLRFYGIGIAAQVNYRLDIIVVSALLSRELVAQYGVAAAAATTVAALGQTVGMVSFGEFATLDSRTEQRAAVTTAVRNSLAFSATLALPVAVAAPFLVPVLFGDDYSPAIRSTQILALAAVPLSVDYVLLHAFIGFGRNLGVVQLVQVGTGLMTVAGIAVASRVGSLEAVAIVSPVVYVTSVCVMMIFMKGR